MKRILLSALLVLGLAAPASANGLCGNSALFGGAYATNDLLAGGFVTGFSTGFYGVPAPLVVINGGFNRGFASGFYGGGFNRGFVGGFNRGFVGGGFNRGLVGRPFGGHAVTRTRSVTRIR